MVVVYASKGPLAGRQVDIPQDQVDAATGKGGWAIKIEPGNQLLADPSAEYDPSWVIPGYSTEDLKPFTKEGKEAATKAKEDAAKAAEAPAKEPEKPTAKSTAAASTPPSESSSKTSAAATVSDSSEKAAADEDKGDAPKTKASSK